MELNQVVTDTEPYTEVYYRSRQAEPFLHTEIGHALQLLDLRPGQRLLELGCGAGELLAAAAARGAEVVGVDSNPMALRIAARVAAALHSEAERLPFPDGTFDALVAQHLIEHFAAPKPLLMEWRRVLARGGRLVLVTPNARYAYLAMFFDPEHRLIFSRRQLRDTLIDSGFQPDCDYTLLPYLGSPRLVPVARRLLWLRHLPWFNERGATILVRARRL